MSKNQKANPGKPRDAHTFKHLRHYSTAMPSFVESAQQTVGSSVDISIHAHLNRLEGNISGLASALESLESRLTAIMTPAIPSGTSDPALDSNSPLGNRICHLADQVDSLLRSVSMLESRVDIS